MANIARTDKYMYNNSVVTVELITEVEWEDLVNFKSKALLNSKLAQVDGVDIPVYREIKNYLVKGE